MGLDSYIARVLLDSVAPTGARITTFELRYPRIVHAQMTRHREQSRSVASSRAIPVATQILKILEDPFVPEEWQHTQKGMIPGPALSPEAATAAEAIWHDALASMARHTNDLVELGVAKEIANRLLEPFSYTVEILTATDWTNFFALRCADDSPQLQVQTIARMMRDAYEHSTPTLRLPGEWHIPMIRGDECQLDLDTQLAISVARCARASYERHNGATQNIEEDRDLFRRLGLGGHWSAYEHQATPAASRDTRSGNLIGWHQLRADFDPRSRAIRSPRCTSPSELPA